MSRGWRISGVSAISSMKSEPPQKMNVTYFKLSKHIDRFFQTLEKVGIIFSKAWKIAAAALLLVAAHAAEDPLAWPTVTREAKPWAYWHWMGSAVDKNNLTLEIERARDAGLG